MPHPLLNRARPPRLPAVRFGELGKEERKAINKVVNRAQLKSGFDHTPVCTQEIGDMLSCFEANTWNTQPCTKEITAMHACVEGHKDDSVGPMTCLRR
jgi:hypothetical protein